MGLIDGQAVSQFTTSLLPGNYHLLFTGNAPLGGRYHIALSTPVRPHVVSHRSTMARPKTFQSRQHWRC